MLNLNINHKIVNLWGRYFMRKLKIRQFSLLFSILCFGINPFWAAALSPQPPSGITVNTTTINFDQPVNIPNDGTPAEIFFNVQNVDGKVWDIDLQTFISHLTPNDLTITLTSPEPLSKTAVIMSRDGKKPSQASYQPKILDDIYHPINELPPAEKPAVPEEIDNIKVFYDVLNGTIWDDQAKSPITEVQYSIETQSKQESLQPEGALDIFRGINPNGIWKLSISDQKPGSINVGSVQEFWGWLDKDECGIFDKQKACDDKAAEYNWETSLECTFFPLGFPGCYDIFFKLKFNNSKDFSDEQSITNCNLIIATASGESPFKWIATTNNVAQSFMNNSVVISGIPVTNQGFNLEELELYTDIEHNYPGDLRISLTSPKGTTTFLTANNGSFKDNIFTNTFWDDQAATPATDAIYQINITKRTLIPEGVLAIFRGEDPNGNWTLKITDEDGNNLNSFGKLNKWALRLTSYISVTPPPPLSVPSAPPDLAITSHSFTNANDFLIPNFQTVEIPLNITGLNGSIWDVNLTTDLTHPSISDLDLFLAAPSGETIALSTANGYQHGPFNQVYVLDQNVDQPMNLPSFPFNNFILPPYDNLFNSTTWDDQAPVPVTDADYSENSPRFQLAPEGAFDVLRGKNPNGIWKLIIADKRDNQSAKGFHRWLNGDSAIQEDIIPTDGFIVNSILKITIARGKAEAKVKGFTNSISTPLTDSISSELPVNGLGNVIEQVRVYTKISHPQSGSLDITVISPSGKKAVLSTGNGGNLANIFNGTLWDDRASTDLRVTDFNFNNDEPQPLLIPEGALAIFRGENPNGVWKLNIANKQIDGTLEEWGLIITSYFASLPPIVEVPPPLPPPPAPAYSQGNAPLFGQKGKRAYILTQKNGVALESPKALAELKPKYKIVAANYFSTVNNTNPALYLILQYKTELSSKIVGIDGGSLTDGDLFLDSLSDRKDKIVASGDLNQDGYNDLVIQGRKRSVKILSGPDFTSPFTLSNDFRKVGKVVGVVNNRILTRKKNLLYATSISIGESNRTIPSEILANGLTPKLKICGAADILETPGLELILQQGKLIGHGPLNLNGPFGFIFTNRSDVTLGNPVGPK